jgi:hypothetical protein
MLISFGNSGQFGNLYFASANRIAHALRDGYKLVSYELSDFRQFFVEEGSEDSVRLGSSFLQKFVVLLGKILGKVPQIGSFDFGFISIHFDRRGKHNLDASILAKKARKWLVVHQGWGIRDRESLSHQADQIRRILDFKPHYRDAAKVIFNGMREEAKYVIGIHVRRGDYEKFRDGRYYFDDAVYLEIAAGALKACNHDPSQVVFIGFSNEPLDWPAEINGARLITRQGAWWEDFLCLSMCDLIIGPPSTFSGAASFANNVPWFQILGKNSIFDLTMARPYLESGIRI